MNKVVEEVEQKVETVVADAKAEVSKVAQKVEDVLSQNDALQILINAIKIAQKRGAYELEETEVILKAVKTFIQSKV